MRTEWTGRNPQKDKLRNRIWTMLEEKGLSIGDPFHEIPNFVGADEAAQRLQSLSIWKNARVVKSNPDDAQIPVRKRVIEDGKKLYMAVPQLTEEKCFVELSLELVKKSGIPVAEAVRWQQAMQIGKHVAFEEMQHIDLALVGCVAVTLDGARIGKGGGFADIEFAILRHYRLIDEKTIILTTIHDEMIVESDEIPLQKHDTFLNYIVTPTTVHEVQNDLTQPGGINWENIQPDQLEEMPILKKLKNELNID